MYINDVVDNVSCSIKLFADETSLYLVALDEAKIAYELIKILNALVSGRDNLRCH